MFLRREEAAKVGSPAAYEKRAAVCGAAAPVLLGGGAMAGCRHGPPITFIAAVFGSP